MLLVQGLKVVSCDLVTHFKVSSFDKQYFIVDSLYGIRYNFKVLIEIQFLAGHYSDHNEVNTVHI